MAFHYGDKETFLTPLSKKSYFLCNLSLVLHVSSKKTLQKNYEKSTY